MKFLKITLCTLLAIILFFALSIFALLFSLNPNRLKPLLEDVVADKGVELRLIGDISWELYPKLGLNLGEMQLFEQTTGRMMSSIKHASATVQLLPLFKRQILVDGLLLDGLQLNYHINQDGSNLWASVLSSSAGAGKVDMEAKSENAKAELAISKIRISNSVLNYQDAQSKKNGSFLIERLNIDNITLDAKPFDLNVRLKANYQDLPAVELDWQTVITLDLGQQTLKFPLSKASITTAGNPIWLEMSAVLGWASQITAEGDIRVSAFELPRLLQAFSIPPPATNRASALKKVAVAFGYSLQGEKLTVNNINIGIDDFSIQGKLTINSLSYPGVVAELKGSSIVLDDYLPPKNQQAQPLASSSPEAEVLPLSFLKELSANIKFTVDHVEYSGMLMDKSLLKLTAKNGVITLDELSSNVADGSIVVKTTMDATSKNEVRLSGSMASTKINMGTLLKTFAEMEQLEGYANINLLFTSHGATDKALSENLLLNGTFDSEGLSLTPFNVEQQFCEVVAMLQQLEAPPHDWPKKTQLEPVSVKFSLANNQLKLESLTAEVAHLTGVADGTVNLNTGAFDIPFQLSLGEFAGAISGCLPIEEKWRKKRMPLRCKGKISAIGAKTCLPDTKLISALIKDKVKEQVKNKVEEKKQQEVDRAEQKAKTKARELLKKELGEDESKAAEEKLRGLLKQLKGK